jgi:hypothetical protein
MTLSPRTFSEGKRHKLQSKPHPNKEILMERTIKVPGTVLWGSISWPTRASVPDDMVSVLPLEGVARRHKIGPREA